MKKFCLILAVLALAALTYTAITRCITQQARAILSSDDPQLNWLKNEYQLTEDQFQKIKELHEAHDRQCVIGCEQLAQSQQALREAILSGRTSGPDYEKILEAWRQQTRQSQDAIVNHMNEVSAVMGGEKGRRYREQVFERLILPRRTPHIDDEGRFDPKFIERLKP